MHLTGNFGASIDRELAIPPFVKASEEGDQNALFRIAEAFANGIGGPPDSAAALLWYRKAIARLENPLNDSGARGRLEMLMLLLKAENHPEQHTDEILALADEGVLAWGEHADRLSLMAREAIASGQLGRQDVDREILYLSRALRGQVWDDEDELIKAAAFYCDYVNSHLGDSEHPVHVVRKEKVKKTIGASGTQEREIEVYSNVVAQPRDVMVPLVFLSRKRPSAPALVSAAALAVTLSPRDLKAERLDETLAFDLFERAATEFDDAAGWLGTGCILLNGWGVPKDAGAAQTRLTKAWEKGATKAALYLAIIQQQHLVANASDAEENTWIRRGAEKGDPACMGHLGMLLMAASDSASQEAGISWLERAAAAGNLEAMADLAAILEAGQIVPKNEARSLELLQTAVSGNSARAKAALATRVAAGRGVPQDQGRALQLLREAAAKDRTAAGNLGVVLWRGDWGEKDVEGGLKWMEASLNAGYWPAGRNLAKIHHLGLGVTPDEEKARTFLEQAGDKGGEESARAVASFYAQGEIITKDPEAAQRWERTAAARHGG